MTELLVAQALIIHKWKTHARKHLLLDIGLYSMVMVFFIADLCLVGLTMGRSPLDDSWMDEHGSGNRFQADSDSRATLLASVMLEFAMLIICFRDLWYALLICLLRQSPSIRSCFCNGHACVQQRIAWWQKNIPLTCMQCKSILDRCACLFCMRTCQLSIVLEPFHAHQSIMRPANQQKKTFARNFQSELQVDLIL
jgi:hypothetical protein